MVEMNKMLPLKHGIPANLLMLNGKRSMSSCIHIEGPMSLSSQPRAAGHRRSVSDPLALHFTKLNSTGGFTTAVKLEPSDGDGTQVQEDDHIKKSENSSLPMEEDSRSGDEVPPVPDSSVEAEPQISTQYKWGHNFKPNMDPKKIKRILANRESARRSRLRKQQYIDELKRNIDAEQAKVSFMSPYVSLCEHQQLILKRENNALKQKLGLLGYEKAYKEAEFQALKKERDALCPIYILLKQGK